MKKVKITFPVIMCLIYIFCIASPGFPEEGAQQNPEEATQPQEVTPQGEGQPAQPQPQAQPPTPVQPPAPAQQPAPPPAATEPSAPLQPLAPTQPPAPPQPPTPGQPPVPPAPAQPPAPPQPQFPMQQPSQPSAQAQPQKNQPTVSFFFDDADIFEVAQTIFADVLKVNYIIDPQVKGRVNFRTVTPIPKDEVLNVMEIIFRLNGIGFVEEGGLYRIIPLADVPKELLYAQVGKPPDKVAIEMFTFKNMDLKESMPDIENALGLQLKGGMVRIIPFYRLNALIVIGSSKDQLNYIKQWVVTFDSMFASARPKIFVYPLQNGKAEHIASLMQSILSGGTAPPAPSAPRTPTPAPATQQARTPATPTAPAQQPAALRTGAAVTAAGGGGGFVQPDTKIFADEITNSLVILATPTDYKFIEETIRKIDIQPRQVVIEGLIAQVTLHDNLSLGFSWSLRTDVNITNIKPFNRDANLGGDVSSIPGGTTLDKTSGSGFTFVATDPKGIVRARLSAALASTNGKVLAAPHVLVADNREARIQVGRQIPLATSTTTAIPVSGTVTDTTSVTSTIQYKDIGIILKVKPQINDSGLVSIELTQEISSVGAPATIASQQFTAIDKTETTTNLVAQDGETIIIGGLIREDVTKEKNGIPFLSKIPLLGNLFSFSNNTTDRTELVILLTPHVVKNHEDAGDVTADYVDRYKGATKDQDIDQFIRERSDKKQSGQ